MLERFSSLRLVNKVMGHKRTSNPILVCSSLYLDKQKYSTMILTGDYKVCIVQRKQSVFNGSFLMAPFIMIGRRADLFKN